MGVTDIFLIAIIILMVAGFWKVFEKAGQPGWAAIIPIYNYYIMAKIAGKPGWWVLLMLIPVVGIIIFIIICIEIAKRFGKSSGFGVGMALLSPIFWPILGFGDAQYMNAGIEQDINNIGSGN